MKLYRSILGIELKRMIAVMNIILLSVFFVIAMYFTLDGVTRYKNNIKEIEEFKKIEQQKVANYNNNKYYANNGFRIILEPPPVSIFFFNSGVGADLYAYLNLLERLNIESSLKGKNLGKERYTGFTDFSGLLLLIGSLLCLFYGSKSFEHREYLKLLVGLKGEKRIYSLIIGARFSLIALFFLVTMVSGILLSMLSGIVFTGSDYLLLLKFSAAVLLVYFILFIMGTITATFKLEKYRIVLMMTIWACLLYIFPIAASKILNVNARSMNSNVRLELSNWNSVMKFEKRAVNEQGKYSKEKAYTREGIALGKSFLTNEYKEIQESEMKIEDGMKGNSQLYHGISSFTPGTFCLSVSNELSGQGYETVVNLFKYAQNMKDNFEKFYFEKEYPPTNKKVESFIKADENVYKSISHIPGTYWPGMGIMAVYAILLTWLSAHRFDKYLYYILPKSPIYQEKKTKIRNQMNTLNLVDGESYFLKREQDRFRDYLYAVFNGKLDPKTKQMMDIDVFLNERDITSNPVKHSFMYVCSPENLPDDIRVKDFVKLFSILLNFSKEETEKIDVNAFKDKLLGEITEAERFILLLNLFVLAKKEIFLVDKSEKGMRPEVYIRLKEKMEALCGQKALVIYLFEHEIEKNPEYYENFNFLDFSTDWKYWIKLLEKQSTQKK
jgi:ABC-type transport system involved in multi-copper enzyme maturation permease subunit